ncbi:MAG: zinc dependent phospholipase C family protein, partial [Oscillospiraceae bacterium]
MADFITHSTFADDILEYAHFDLKQHCARHANLFRLGAQGPDLFFYFEIRRHSLSYGRIGSNLHKALSVEDVLSKVSALKSTDNDFGEKIAFLLGFACHLSLDSFVHPYIKEREPQIAKLENCSNRCAHIKLETQFEAYQYGERTGKKPSAFNWHMDLPLNDRERQIAAELIGELSEVLNEKYTDKAT